MKTTIYEKYLECYISNDQECFEDGAGYGCGVGHITGRGDEKMRRK